VLNHLYGQRSHLKSICIPSSIEALGIHSFRSCCDLREVSFGLGSRVSSLTRALFRDCSGLSSICIPGSVETICNDCFLACKALSRVMFALGSQLLRVEESAFRWCESLSSICLPSSVEVLGEACFFHCANLSAISFESTAKLVRIEQSAFQTIGSQVTFGSHSTVHIDKNAFQGYSSLSSRAIPSSFWTGWTERRTPGGTKDDHSSRTCSAF
jgi:hypothetical protein